MYTWTHTWTLKTRYTNSTRLDTRPRVAVQRVHVHVRYASSVSCTWIAFDRPITIYLYVVCHVILFKTDQMITNNALTSTCLTINWSSISVDFCECQFFLNLTRTSLREFVNNKNHFAQSVARVTTEQREYDVTLPGDSRDVFFHFVVIPMTSRKVTSSFGIDVLP